MLKGKGELVIKYTECGSTRVGLRQRKRFLEKIVLKKRFSEKGCLVCYVLWRDMRR